MVLLCGLIIMILGAALVVIDTLENKHLLVHEHEITHTHDGSTHSHVIEHKHTHYIQENIHSYKQDFKEEKD